MTVEFPDYVIDGEIVTVHEDGDCGGTLVVTDEGQTLHCAACDTDVAILCACGEEWLDREETYLFTFDERPLSEGCSQSDFNYASTLLRYGPGQDTEDGANKVIFGDLQIMGQYGEAPDWFAEVVPTEGVEGLRVWKNTSGYRGHHDTWSRIGPRGYTKIVDGWVTGDYDDVPWKRDTHTLLQTLEENEPPVPVYVLFEPTSNVFSMGTDVFTKADDYDAAVTWLDEQFGLSVDRLESAFR